jgi:hypothetical protein
MKIKEVVMRSKFSIRIYAGVAGMIAVLLLTTRCTDALKNESASAPIQFPSDAVAGQTGMIEITVPAVAVSVTSSPANAVVCDPTLIQNSGGEGIKCAFAAVGSGSVTVNIAVTDANGQVTNYSTQGQVTLPSTPLTQDTFSVAITNPKSNSTSTVTSSSTSGGMPSTVMQLSTPISLQGSVVAPGSVEVINWGDGITQTLDPSEVSLTHTYVKPGAYTLNIAAAGDGAAGSLSVGIQVQCDSSIPPMAVALAQISASVVGASDNQYNFTANVTGGSGNFTSLWSPDGTGVYRDPAASGLKAQYYVDYSGTRTIQAIVTDVACGNQVSLTQSYDFKIPTANGTPGQLQGPQVGNVAFIQGLISSSSNSTDMRLNGFMALLQAASDPAPNRLMGNYQVTTGAGPYPGSFNESGFTTINDNKDGIVINTNFDSSGNMTVQNVTVDVAGNDELGSLLYDTYTSSSCAGAGTVTSVMGPNPCTNGTPGTVVLQYIIDYTYSCPTLTDSSGHTISLVQGAGYYVVNTSNGTCGGSGQSGGSAPPAF